jgi:hypothetical protein
VSEAGQADGVELQDYGRRDEVGFRKIIPILLLVPGLALIF